MPAVLRRLIAVVLFVVTVLCVDRFARIPAVMFLMGTEHRLVAASSPDVFWLSLWYTVPLMGFLLAHEGGHLLAARACRVPTKGPFFLPMPTWAIAITHLPIPAIGTLGAFIRISPTNPLDRWHIAVMGPIMGLVWALACVLVGSALSGHGQGYGVYVPHALRPLTDGAIWHPTLLAGYAGVVITGLNLLPIPGLDGWHLVRTFPALGLELRWATVLVWITGCLCLI